MKNKKETMNLEAKESSGSVIYIFISVDFTK